MRATAKCLGKGFFGRSMDDIKRYCQIVYTQENIKGATRPYVLSAFHEPDCLEDFKIICDYKDNGFSKAQIDWIPPSTNPSPKENPNGHIRFHGSISTRLPLNRPDIYRSGYAAFRTRDRGPTIFGHSLWNIDPYYYLALRVKSDGRKYLVNLQTESIVPTDIHQHRLRTRKTGEWETVLIRWNDFVRTNHGTVTEPQSEIMRDKIRTVGIGLTDGVEGPFDLSVERIWATNWLQDEEIKEDDRDDEWLKSTHGDKISWNTMLQEQKQKKDEEKKRKDNLENNDRIDRL